MARAQAWEEAVAQVASLLRQLSSANASAHGQDRAVLWAPEKRTHTRRETDSHGHSSDKTSHSFWVMLFVPGFSAHGNMFAAAKLGLS